MEAKINKAREYAWKAFVPLSIGAVVYLVVSFSSITFHIDRILMTYMKTKNSRDSKLQMLCISSLSTG